MGWKLKIKHSPHIGDIKEKTKFAFLPTKVNNDYIWLKKYIVTYEYRKYYLEFHDYEIKCFGWIEKDKKNIKK